MKWNKLILVFILMLTLVLSGCARLRPPVNVKADLGLNQVRDMEDLKTLLSKRNTRFGYDLFSIFGARNEAVTDMAPEGTETVTSGSHSTTNVQVDGVDEGDIIKTDGNRIYYISYDRLRVVDLNGDGSMQLALNVQLDSVEQNAYRYSYFHDLYVTDRYLVVIGQTWYYTYYDVSGTIKGSDGDIEDHSYVGLYAMSTPVSLIYLYDIQTLEQVKTIETSGYYLTSRLVEDSLYFMTNHYSWYGYDNDANYDPRPWYKVDDELSVPKFTDIKYVPGMYYQSFTSIVSLKLSEEITVNQQVFLGRASWGQVYMNHNRLYFASTDYEYDLLGGYKQIGTLISYELNHNEATVSYGGAGTYRGYIINQFAMDEYDGYMRIVTTEGWGDSVKNRLYVFEPVLEGNKKILKEIAGIFEGIGKPRETVRSVRFNNFKEIVTIVTYEQTDPFYTIDLSNPNNPTIRGALEVTGFSLYQHPWTENLVIGIGQEAEGTMITGLKLALYDITDIDNPVEVGQPLILPNSNNSWVWSEALYNHKSILIAKEYNMIGFSVYQSRWFESYYAQNNDYVLFDIDVNSATPITMKQVISHYPIFTETNPTQDSYYNSYNYSIERSVYANGYLYAISSEAVTSHTLVGEFTQVSRLLFQSLTN